MAKRNNNNDLIRVTICMPRAVREALRVMAAKRGICTSLLIKELIRALFREEKVTKDLPMLKKAQRMIKKAQAENGSNEAPTIKVSP